MSDRRDYTIYIIQNETVPGIKPHSEPACRMTTNFPFSSIAYVALVSTVLSDTLLLSLVSPIVDTGITFQRVLSDAPLFAEKIACTSTLFTNHLGCERRQFMSFMVKL